MAAPTHKNPTAYSVGLTPPADAYDDGRLTLCGVRVSSPRLDRDREVLVPQGCRLDDFRNNPVALWCHDQKQLPVGSWADAGGNCTVVVRADDGVFGDLTFSQANPLGRVLYGMYREKVLKAFSVGFTPVAGRKMSPDETKAFAGGPGGVGGPGGRPVAGPGGLPDRLPGYMHTVWDLLEISPVAIGANPDALAKVVAKGAAAGDRLPADLRRKLAEFVPGAKWHRAFPVATGGAGGGRQATAAVIVGATHKTTLAGSLTKALQTLEATVSQTAAATATKDATAAGGTDTTTKAAGAGTTAAGGTVTKDVGLSTTDDTAGGSVVGASTDDAAGGAAADDREPHEKVTDGLADAMHASLDQCLAGEITPEEFKAAFDQYIEHHTEYSGAGGSEGDEAETEADPENKGDDTDDEDDEDVKAIADAITKAVAAAVAPLAADLAAVKAKLADIPTGDEIAEAIATS